MKKTTTHFGYQQVALDEKVQRVRAVFDSVADRYDLMNDLMSFGVHRLWKRFAVELAGVRRGSRVLDAAGGTGDLAWRFLPLVGETGKVVLSDINANMLHRGRDRLIERGLVAQLDYVQANAEELPFADHSFDVVSIGFGLRNVTDKLAALRSMLRVLKPGGRVMILEFSEVKVPLFKQFYDVYSFLALPLLGKWVVGDEESYRYLAESIRMHPNQETLLGLLKEAGFERCDYHNLSGGVVAVHRGYKL